MDRDRTRRGADQTTPRRARTDGTEATASTLTARGSQPPSSSRSGPVWPSPSGSSGPSRSPTVTCRPVHRRRRSTNRPTARRPNSRVDTTQPGSVDDPAAHDHHDRTAAGRRGARRTDVADAIRDRARRAHGAGRPARHRSRHRPDDDHRHPGRCAPAAPATILAGEQLDVRPAVGRERVVRRPPRPAAGRRRAAARTGGRGVSAARSRTRCGCRSTNRSPVRSRG